MGILPGQDLNTSKEAIKSCVATASEATLFCLTIHLKLSGTVFRRRAVLGEGNPAIAAMNNSHATVFSSQTGLPEQKITALTDTRSYGLYYDIPEFCYGPVAENIHGLMNVLVSSLYEKPLKFRPFYCGMVWFEFLTQN